MGVWLHIGPQRGFEPDFQKFQSLRYVWLVGLLLPFTPYRPSAPTPSPGFDLSPIMASPGNLCSWCNQVPFDPNILRGFKDETKWSLGPLSRIQRSDCPCCRLLRFTLFKDGSTIQIDWKAHAEVSLRLRRDPPLGYGPCFEVMAGGQLSLTLYFVKSQEQSDGLSDGDGAFCLMPNHGQTLDFARVRGWLSQCTSNHGTDCNGARWKAASALVEDNFPGLDVLRLIDVLNECVVQTRVLKPYVALSYVWGLAPNFRLTTWSEEEVTRQHGLRDYGYALPRTIRHAMAFVKGIGQQYLWCDALCLRQNDPEDVRRGVNAMDMIFERALLTVVAASGHDANSGLPGVEEGSRFMPRYPEDIVPGVQLDAYVELDQVMKYSVHSSRAWTYVTILWVRGSAWALRLLYKHAADFRKRSCPDVLFTSSTTKSISGAGPRHCSNSVILPWIAAKSLQEGPSLPCCHLPFT